MPSFRHCDFGDVYGFDVFFVLIRQGDIIWSNAFSSFSSIREIPMYKKKPDETERQKFIRVARWVENLFDIYIESVHEEFECEFDYSNYEQYLHKTFIGNKSI